jgi:small subunit ribosomal protein S3
MGQKINPKLFRLGYNIAWQSVWCDEKNYTEYFVQDLKVRKYLDKRLSGYGVEKVMINITQNLLDIVIYSSKLGLVIGSKGENINKVKGELEKLIKGKVVKVTAKESRKPDLSSAIVAENIAMQLKRRMNAKRILNFVTTNALESGAVGIKVRLAGRITGGTMAKVEKAYMGKIAIQTLNSEVDYTYLPAETPYGIIGIKVWICRGVRRKNDLRVQNARA